MTWTLGVTWTKVKKLYLSLKFINASNTWYSMTLTKLQIFFLVYIQKIKFHSTQISQKDCLFLLKFDYFRYAAIFQCQKTEMIKLWLNSIISNHEWTSNAIREVTHWLKKHVCILREFSIYWGDSNHTVLP